MGADAAGRIIRGAMTDYAPPPSSASILNARTGTGQSPVSQFREWKFQGWKFQGWKFQGWKFQGWKFQGWKFQGWKFQGWKFQGWKFHPWNHDSVAASQYKTAFSHGVNGVNGFSVSVDSVDPV